MLCDKIKKRGIPLSYTIQLYMKTYFKCGLTFRVGREIKLKKGMVKK